MNDLSISKMLIKSSKQYNIRDINNEATFRIIKDIKKSFNEKQWRGVQYKEDDWMLEKITNDLIRDRIDGLYHLIQNIVFKDKKIRNSDCYKFLCYGCSNHCFNEKSNFKENLQILLDTITKQNAEYSIVNFIKKYMCFDFLCIETIKEIIDTIILFYHCPMTLQEIKTYEYKKEQEQEKIEKQKKQKINRKENIKIAIILIPFIIFIIFMFSKFYILL